MDLRNEVDKRKLGDFWHRKHLERREKKLYARQQYRNTPAMEYDYENHRPKHSVRNPSSTSVLYTQPETPPPSSPTIDSECVPAEMQVKNQKLPTRLASPMVYDYLTVEDEQELSSLLYRKLLGVPINHLPDLTLTDILYQSPKATHLPQYSPPPQPYHLTIWLTLPTAFPPISNSPSSSPPAAPSTVASALQLRTNLSSL